MLKQIDEASLAAVSGGVTMSPDGRTCTDPRPFPFPRPNPLPFPPGNGSFPDPIGPFIHGAAGSAVGATAGRLIGQ